MEEKIHFQDCTYSLKKIYVYRWTCVVQNLIVQGSTVYQLTYEGAIHTYQEEILVVIKVHLFFLNIKYILLSKYTFSIWFYLCQLLFLRRDRSYFW